MAIESGQWRAPDWSAGETRLCDVMLKTRSRRARVHCKPGNERPPLTPEETYGQSPYS